MKLAKFGRKIMRARRAQDMTQRELQRHSGVSQSEISAIEIGVRVDPKFNTMRKLAFALGISLDELAGRKGSS